ncbi:MAG: transposase [Victivallaceae bacterium]|nr:transposase [Victivallaceae bacterium]
MAESLLKRTIDKYKDKSSELAQWLESEPPEGFSMFSVAESLNARRKLRTTNMVEFQNKELKKRTRCIRVFPNRESLLRIASALLIELDETWLAEDKVYIAG